MILSTLSISTERISTQKCSQRPSPYAMCRGSSLMEEAKTGAPTMILPCIHIIWNPFLRVQLRWRRRTGILNNSGADYNGRSLTFRKHGIKGKCFFNSPLLVQGVILSKWSTYP